jgi:CBS domain-containing protein
MMKTVGDIMTRHVIVLTEEENLSGLEEGMKGFGLRHLPVVDDGKLVGLVSHRDLLRVSVSSLDNSGDQKNERLFESTFVGEIMTRHVRTARPNTPVVEAARDLVDGRFGCLPVVDEDGTVVGIITEADLLKMIVELLDDDRGLGVAAEESFRPCTLRE